MQNYSKTHLLAVQLVFMAVWFVSQSQSVGNALKWATVVARYTVYLLTARGLQEACSLVFDTLSIQRPSYKKLFEENKTSLMTYAAAAAILVISQQRPLGEDFPLFLAAYLVCQYLQIEQRPPQPTISYGTGMACSFFEGYLKHVIPSDGKDDGFVEKIRKWENTEGVSKTSERPKITDVPFDAKDSQRKNTKEDLERPDTKDYIPLGTFLACFYLEDTLKHELESDGKDDGFMQRMIKWDSKEGVVFPVKRLLLVITKSLFCPPDLQEFNDHNRDDLPQLVPCVDKSLEEVRKDVAGVKGRRYSNTTYVIRWRNNAHPPVYLAVECATPLHTLYGVLQNHQLYRELVSVDKEVLVSDFVQQLQLILARSPACRGKCELVFFDESSQYLPEVLLQKIRQIEPNYLDIINRHQEQYGEEEIPLHAPPRVLQPHPI